VVGVGTHALHVAGQSTEMFCPRMTPVHGRPCKCTQRLHVETSRTPLHRAGTVVCVVPVVVVVLAKVGA